MNREQRKAALTAYRERKAVAGIYAVICHASGQRWVGRALDLGTVQNRLWFTLRQGGYPHPLCRRHGTGTGPTPSRSTSSNASGMRSRPMCGTAS